MGFIRHQPGRSWEKLGESWEKLGKAGRELGERWENSAKIH